LKPLLAMHHVADANALTDWLVDAKAGEQAVYHCGHLASDLAPGSSGLSQQRRRELAVLAQAAWRLAEGGLVHLVQRRVDETACAYLVIARRRPLVPIQRPTPPVPHASVRAEMPSPSKTRSIA
jgi:hypothetical protein